jgi:DNA-binding NarL/FixJ family response regulator
MLRILIADDHDLIRKGVRDVIETHAGWAVCGEASDGQQALELALCEKPDVAVVDVSLPIMNGVALTRRLRQECPTTRVLLFTMHDDDETVGGGLAAGARGYPEDRQRAAPGSGNLRRRRQPALLLFVRLGAAAGRGG